MIILMNCPTTTADEGGLKVANTLSQRIKAANPGVTVVSYGPGDAGCDVHIPVNGKLMMNARLARFLLKRREPVLYFPAYTRMRPTAAHLLVLSLAARWGIQAVCVMRSPMDKWTRLMLRMSGANVVLLSAESWQEMRTIIGARARYLRTGVDTKRFCPVDDAQKKQLREKYGIPCNAPVVLHVGHLKAGRNVDKLRMVDPALQVVVVASTATEQDTALRQTLLERGNVTVIDQYVPRIEEIYQMADVYLFPVMAERNCIDVPLSALEAAACGIPVAATSYGELKQLLDGEGFYCLDSLEPEAMNRVLHQAIRERKNPRAYVLAYDWDRAAGELLAATGE